MKTLDSRPVPRPPPRVLTAVILGALCLGGCKPADEPMRRVARVELEEPPALPVTPPPAPPSDEDFRVELPPRPALPAPDPDPTEPTEPAEPVEPPPADAVQALLRPVSSADEDRARAMNATGLRAHRRRDFDAAISAYQSALEAWPAHVLARYNLACAEALRGSPERAMEELGTLARLGEAGVDILRSLEKARVDEDFRSLRSREDFRALTGRTEILLAFASGDPDAEDGARRALVALTDAHHSARLAMLDAETLSEGIELEALASDAIAVAVAPKVASIAGATRTRLVERPAGGDAPLVITFRSRSATSALPPAEPPPPLPSPATDGAVATRIEDLFGVRLTAREETRTHQLLLKATGFFDWTITEADGAVEKRSGRYRTTGDLLSLSFRSTRSGGDPSAPTLETTEGLSADHPVRLDGGALRVGELEFRR